MRKVLFAVLAVLIPALVSAQNAVILPEGSNTLKALHLRGYPGLGIYSPSAGVLLFGNGTEGISCTWGGTCTVTLSGTTPTMGRYLIFDGTTAGGGAVTLDALDPAFSSTFALPNVTGMALMNVAGNFQPEYAHAVWADNDAVVYEGSTANEFETSLPAVNPTADRTIYLPDASGTVILNTEFSFQLTADVIVQYGQAVMPDAGTADRFDVNGAGGTGALGILAGTGPSAQGTAYPIIFGGIGYVAIAEDQDVALSEYLVQSGTAGYCNAGAISTIGLNVGRVLMASPVTNTINPAGCTGGSGCINTALNTPNAGPAGQITLAADVAAQGWAVNDAVGYWNSGGTTPTGLTDGKVYFLVSVATTNVTIAATKGGAVVVPTSQGDDATQYLQKLPKSIIHVY